MSFPTNRQNRLNPVLDALKGIAGIKSVQQDDFDSGCIDVHTVLGGTQYKLDQPLRLTKLRIRKALKALGVDFRFSDWPAKSRSYDGKDYHGKTVYVDNGYDHHNLSIVVDV